MLNYLIHSPGVTCIWPTSKVSDCHFSFSSRDRVGLFFQDLSAHLTRVISSAAQYHFLLERGVVSVLHLALRLLGRREFPVIQVS